MKKKPVERNHDNLLIVGLSVPDPEILDFVVYLGKNKPDLKVLLYASDNHVWLQKLNAITCGNLAPSFCTVTAKLNDSVVRILNKQQASKEAVIESRQKQYLAT